MSRIEQLIGEIEEYIDSCKFQPLSNTKILVNKEELEELLVELRLRIPDEIKKYQKIISNQDAILNEARAQAVKFLPDTAVSFHISTSAHSSFPWPWSLDPVPGICICIRNQKRTIFFFVRTDCLFVHTPCILKILHGHRAFWMRIQI